KTLAPHLDPATNDYYRSLPEGKKNYITTEILMHDKDDQDELEERKGWRNKIIHEPGLVVVGWVTCKIDEHNKYFIFNKQTGECNNQLKDDVVGDFPFPRHRGFALVKV